MSKPPEQTPTAPADGEALRQRWQQAKANGTVEAFVRELIGQAVPIPPPPGAAYESEQERAAYAQARGVPACSADVLELLPLYFGDEPGLPVEEILPELAGGAGHETTGHGTATDHASGG